MNSTAPTMSRSRKTTSIETPGASAPGTVPQLPTGSWFAEAFAFSAAQRARLADLLGVTGEAAEVAIATIERAIGSFRGHRAAFAARPRRGEIADEAEGILAAARAGDQMPAPSRALVRTLGAILEPPAPARATWSIGEQLPAGRAFVLESFPRAIDALRRRGRDRNEAERRLVVALALAYHAATGRAPRRALDGVTGEEIGFARFFRVAVPESDQFPIGAILRDLQAHPDWPRAKS